VDGQGYFPSGESIGLCQTFQGQPSECSDYVVSGKKIWVPSNTTQASIASYNSGYLEAASNVPEDINNCQNAASQFICGNAFRPCLILNYTNPITNTTESFTLGSPVCRSVCDDFVSYCKDYFDLAGQGGLLPNCSMKISGIPAFPNEGQPITLDFYNTDYRIDCFIPPAPSAPCILGFLDCSASELKNFVHETVELINIALSKFPK